MHRFFSIPSIDLPGTFVLTVLMSLFAVVLAMIFRTADRYLCMAAMIVSSGGDIFLMNFKGLSKCFPNYFYIGAILFMTAHIIYAAAFYFLIKKNSYPLYNTGFMLGVGIVFAVFVILVFLIVKAGKYDISMILLCFFYLIAIGSDFCIIFSLAYSAKGLALLTAAGAVSFFISDLIIGLDRLTGISTPLLDELIWWFYPVGQILLIIGG